MSIDVREITLQDVDRVCELENAIFSDAWSKKALKESLEQENALILGAWKDEHLCGYLIVYFAVDEGEIVRIAVDASCRRCGVAGHMLLNLENVCEEKQVNKLFLEVRESNQTAIDFYKNNGFCEDGLRKNFYTKPVEDAVLMSRELGR